MVVGLIVWLGNPLSGSNLADAQEPEIRTEAGKDFRNHARSQWQRTDALPLGKDDPLELSKAERKKRETSSTPISTNGMMRVLATIILVVLIAIAIYLLIQHRLGGDLFSRKKVDEKIGGGEETIAGLNVAEAGKFSLSDLDKMSPEEALHILLVNSLAKAADANRIPLRRSLTAREVFNKVPQRWAHRGFLGKLIRRAEPVLFGGRDIAAEEVKELSREAKALFSGVRLGMGR